MYSKGVVKDLLSERTAQGQILKPLTKDNIYLVSLFRVNKAKILNSPCERRIGSQGLNRGDMVLNKISSVLGRRGVRQNVLRNSPRSVY